MRKITLTQILMLALTLTGLTTMAQTNYFIDFNHTDATTGNWNNISGVTVGTTVNDLISDAGDASTFDMAVTDDFVAANNDGTTTPGVAVPFPGTATKDSFYVQDGTSNTTGAITFSGLNVSNDYSFVIFASRMGATNSRVAKYTFTGAVVTTATLDAQNNTNNICSVSNLKPDASGNIVLKLEKDASSVGTFVYLGAIKLTEIVPVAPQVLLTAENGSAVEGEFLHVDAIKMHVMANGPGQSVADFEVVDNPSVAGINTSAKVVKFTRRTSGADAMPWGGFWTDVIEETLRPDMTVNKYVHVKVLKQQATPQKFKLEGGTTTPTWFELNSINAYTTVGQWQDVVFYFPDANSTYQRVGFMPDFEDPLTAGADRIIYFDDITVNNSSTPVTAGIQDNYLASRIAMFPNPAQNILYIDTMDELQSVNIFTIEGRQVTAKNNLSVGMNQIDLSNLNAGVYLVKFTATNGASLTQKVIKK